MKTNADKYLKEEVNKKDLATKLAKRLIKYGKICCYEELITEDIINFFIEEDKPELTEAEKNILKNIDEYYKYIGRDKAGRLYLADVKNELDNYKSFGFNLYFHYLFQFIDINKEYNIKKLLGDESYEN